MFISLSFWQINFYNCHSLKDKRRWINSLTDRLRRKLAVSCRLVSGQGGLKSGELAVVSIVSSGVEAERLKQQIEKEIVSTPEVFLVGVKDVLLGREVFEDELSDRAFESPDKKRNRQDD